VKRIFSFVMMLVFLAGCSGTAPASVATSVPTSLPTDTAQVVPSQPTATTVPVSTTASSAPLSSENTYAFEQNQRLGRGVNLGNALEAPNEGEWGMTLEESFFQTIEGGGFDSVRIPIRWSGHIAAQAPYTIDPVFLKRVDWAIDQAFKHHLAAVINIHAFDEIMEAPAGNKNRFLAIWKQLAEHYQGYSDGLYFELLNEPYGTLGNTVWLSYATEAIQEIRKTNPKRMVIVGPGNWNNVNNLEELFLLPNDRYLIATFHYYLPFHFTHQGAEWVDGSTDWMGTTWKASEDEKNAVLHDFDQAAEWSQKNQRPVYLGEFGAYSKADSDSRHLWTAFVARTAEARGFSWAYWEFGAGFGVYDRVKKSWNDAIYSALFPK
jgi:endoglucanase